MLEPSTLPQARRWSQSSATGLRSSRLRLNSILQRDDLGQRSRRPSAAYSLPEPEPTGLRREGPPGCFSSWILEAIVRSSFWTMVPWIIFDIRGYCFGHLRVPAHRQVPARIRVPAHRRVHALSRVPAHRRSWCPRRVLAHRRLPTRLRVPAHRRVSAHCRDVHLVPGKGLWR